MAWKNDSEELQVTVRGGSRQELVDRFTAIARDYFSTTSDNLLIRCFGAGITNETVNIAGEVTSYLYEAQFGACRGHHTDDVT